MLRDRAAAILIQDKVTGGDMRPGTARMDFELEQMNAQFADGGTHVASTTEVGPIRVVRHESKGRINQRIRMPLSEERP